MADKSISLDIFDDYDVVVNDFYTWEILDPYNDSDSDDFSFSDGDAAPADDVSTEIKVISQYFGSPSSDVSLVSQSPHHRHLVVDEVIPPVVTEDLSLNAFVSFPPPAVSVVSQLPPHFKEIDVDDVMPKSDQKDVRIGVVTYGDFEGKYDDEDDEYDDEAGYNDLYDDELVPIGVSGKLGKQRIRKSGKKGYGRKKNSKKLPHYSTRPGCVHGKHGLCWGKSKGSEQCRTRNECATMKITGYTRRVDLRIFPAKTIRPQMIVSGVMKNERKIRFL